MHTFVCSSPLPQHITFCTLSRNQKLNLAASALETHTNSQLQHNYNNCHPHAHYEATNFQPTDSLNELKHTLMHNKPW